MYCYMLKIVSVLVGEIQGGGRESGGKREERKERRKERKYNIPYCLVLKIFSI